MYILYIDETERCFPLSNFSVLCRELDCCSEYRRIIFKNYKLGLVFFGILCIYECIIMIVCICHCV